MNSDSVLVAVAIAAGLFAGPLLALNAGRRIGERRRVASGEAASPGFGAIEGAVFGLLGLLIAFTFSGAAARFDTRRELIVQEANAIGTAYLRLEVLPAEPRAALQAKMRRYVDARLAAYRKVPDMEAVKTELKRAEALQQEIWQGAVAAVVAEGGPAITLLLPALNEMIDITTTRTASTRMHPPAIIFAMLGVMVLVSAMFAGFGMAGSRGRSWLHILGFTTTLALTVYVILDLEYPRLGLIRVDSFDQFLVDVRAGMR